jgi:formate/nitrite transporter FocA (FNT family)
VAAGAAKASKSFSDIFKLGIVSGAHIGFGSYLAITVGGACPGIAAANPGLQKVRISFLR